MAAGETVTVEPSRAAAVSEILSDAELLRYNRQIVLKSFDFEGRRRSSNPACWSSAPGPRLRRQPVSGGGRVGHLTLVDFDRVELSNLQRQVLHSDARIGQLKVESAATSLRALTPGSRWRLHAARRRGVADALLPAISWCSTAPTTSPSATQPACLPAIRRPLVSGAAIRLKKGSSAASPGGG